MLEERFDASESISRKESFVYAYRYYNCSLNALPFRNINDNTIRFCAILKSPDYCPNNLNRCMRLTFHGAILRAYAWITALQFVAFVIRAVNQIGRAGRIIFRHLIAFLVASPNASVYETIIAADKFFVLLCAIMTRRNISNKPNAITCRLIQFNSQSSYKI